MPGEIEQPLVAFGPFELDRSTGELRRAGAVVDLAPQPTRVLIRLVESAGRLVTRDELRELLWPDTVVEFDHGLNTCIRQIRDALGETADAPTYIQTVPRRGYRFIAPTAAVQPAGGTHLGNGVAAPPAPPRPRRHWARLGWAAAVVLLIGGAAFAVLRESSAPKRVAVLPFQNLSPGRLPPHFVDGLSEELILELARYQPTELAVISRTSAKRYGDASRSMREIREGLGATFVVQGTVRARGDTIEVTAALTRTRDEVTVWSARFGARDFDPLEQMAPLGRRIAGAMAGSLLPSAGSALRSSSDPEARAAFLKGRYLTAESKPLDALPHLEEAVRRDPAYALAHAELARARLLGGDPEGAASAAARALELDPRLPEVHQALADLAALADWNWDRALERFRAALALAPGRADLRQGYAYVLALSGRPDEALSEIRLALGLDPLSPLVNGDVAWLFLYLRRYDEAAEQARVTLDLRPDLAGARYCLLLALEGAGDLAEAQAVAADVARRYHAGAATVEEIRRAAPAAALDRFWRWDLEQMRANDLGNRFPLEFAAAFVRFRQTDSALVYIDRSIALRGPLTPSIAVDPRFDPLRGEARFGHALARLGFSAEDQRSAAGAHSRNVSLMAVPPSRVSR